MYLNLIFAALLLVFPVEAWAQIIWTVDTGIPPLTIPQIIRGLIYLLHGLAFIVMSTTFIIGAVYAMVSGGQENVLAKGKTLMKSALFGIGIVSGSWLIMSTFLWILQNG